MIKILGDKFLNVDQVSYKVSVVIIAWWIKWILIIKLSNIKRYNVRFIIYFTCADYTAGKDMQIPLKTTHGDI